MIKLIKFILAATAVIALNGVYFEFFLNRETPLPYTSLSGLIVLIVDIWSITKGVQVLKEVLKF